MEYLTCLNAGKAHQPNRGRVLPPIIFMTGFACYALMLQARQRSDTVVQEINEFDRVRFEKELTVTDLDTTFPRVWAYTPT